MVNERFVNMYQSGRPPWDIDGPQPALAALAEAGYITGDVLDAGCGTGENALYLASRGLKVTGVDYVPAAIEQARKKARERALEAKAEFLAASALELETLGRTFDSVIDCGLFHTFEDADRARYVASLSQATRPGSRLALMCFSDREPAGFGPRRISRDEIESSFGESWTIESIEPTRFQTADVPDAKRHSEGGPHAWLVRARRTG